ncbi:S24 family peptidase [Moritella sp. 36]|uniref:S24 family peptidase n=1 Tax=Moritella sp. 36 TaxID=2746233 RepID=UPI002105CAAF|nr:S24 family peptidase [Moritella sp. 36]
MRYGNNLLVKRLQMLPGGIIRVKSDNSMYDPWEITKSQLDGEELALIGRVVWTGKKM